MLVKLTSQIELIRWQNKFESHQNSVSQSPMLWDIRGWQCWKKSACMGFRLNLGNCSKMIIFGSLSTTFEVSNIFWGSGRNLLEPKISNHSEQEKISLYKFPILLRIHFYICGIYMFTNRSKKESIKKITISEIEFNILSYMIWPRPKVVGVGTLFEKV